MQVLVSNRQHRIRIDAAGIKAMASDLSDLVLADLLKQPIASFSKRKIRRLKEKASLSLVILSNEGIRKINKRWRGKDAETDVLSFALNLDEPGDGMPWELGEIFISLEKASEQAITHNHGLDRELAFLFVHGMLHILGFDHENKKDEKVMFARQKIILKEAGYPRS